MSDFLWLFGAVAAALLADYFAKWLVRIEERQQERKGDDRALRGVRRQRPPAA